MGRGWIALIVICCLAVITVSFMRWAARNSAQSTSEEFCRAYKDGDVDALVLRRLMDPSALNQVKQAEALAGGHSETRSCNVSSAEPDWFGLEWKSTVSIREYGPITPDTTCTLKFTGHGKRITEAVVGLQ